MGMGGSSATRAELLLAAALEIRERGYSGASFSSVAARLGLTKGAFAYHFPTKRDIAVALMDEFSNAFTRAIEHSREKFPKNNLKTAMSALIEIELEAENDPVVSAAFTLMLDPQPPVDDIHEKFLWWIEIFKEFIQNAVEADEVDLPVPLDDAAEFLIVSLLGLTTLSRRTLGNRGVKESMHLQLLFTAIGVRDIDEFLGDTLPQPVS